MLPTAQAQTTEADFAKQLEALSQDASLIAAAAAERERFVRLQGDPLGAQASYWIRASQTAISDLATTMIVTFEVSSKASYQQLYQKPVWPKGSSGVTIGIGYDLGYSSSDKLKADWGSLLDEQSVKRLGTAVGVKGANAEKLAKELKDVTVGWDPAIAQFKTFLPYAIGKTEDTFPNASQLSANALGALVSLIYNRGASLSPTSTRRREMREIYTLMKDKKFADVPQKIREMKRLWINQPELKGVVERREKEAQLFEIGLA